jgi:hypothetical protein
LFGGDDGLDLFDAIAASGPLDASSAASVSASAGTRPVVRLRRGAGGRWSAFLPVVEGTAAPRLDPSRFRRAATNDAHILMAGQRPISARTLAAPREGCLRESTEAWPAPPHDWGNAAAPTSPTKRSAIPVVSMPASLPLFEAPTEHAGSEEPQHGVVTPGVAKRLRAGLSRGARTRRG